MCVNVCANVLFVCRDLFEELPELAKITAALPAEAMSNRCKPCLSTAITKIEVNLQSKTMKACGTMRCRFFFRMDKMKNRIERDILAKVYSENA